MIGILKIGMTMRTPVTRLIEANRTDTWRPPTPYKLEFAKRVCNPKQKEKTLHILLAQYTERINPHREFFRISVEEVNTFFSLIDGELWTESNQGQQSNHVEENKQMISDQDITTDVDDGESESPDTDIDVKKASTNPFIKKKYRHMSKYFTHDQRIRHAIENNVWIGKYDYINNGIVFNNQFYKSLGGFASAHSNKTENGWKECECEVNGKWVSTFDL